MSEKPPSQDGTTTGRHGDGSDDQPERVPVVGIGASAGGLEAFEQLFSHLPADTGLTYVVVQHLAPQHASMLTQLLGRQTAMPVVEAKDGMSVEANHVYVIAPGTVLGISGGKFHVTAIDSDRHTQIDIFLQSLAEDLGRRAVGVVLSGSGSDGTEGLRAIGEHGGLTLAQAPHTAKYDAMPRSAITAGVAARVLLIEEMATELLAHARRLQQGRAVAEAAPRAVPTALPAAVPSDEEIVASLGRVYELLHDATGHDFSHYKHGTVLRRFRRRLQRRCVASVDEYLTLLDKDAQEPGLLAKDLLIGVTQFFREPETFEHLAAHVLPRILAAGRADAGVRIWVQGCASGEEAYSIGILIRELLGDRTTPIQIFATDIDAEAIAEARQGRYPAAIAQHVSPERLARFFVQAGGAYVVANEVREMCIFSEHSVIRDPPFLSLDLISCRNVLIYLDAELQKKLVPLFHYALKPGGYLFLGSSENLASHAELFEIVDKRFRIFRRREVLNRPMLELPLGGRPGRTAAPPVPPVSAAPPSQAQVVNAAFERLMLQEYTPAGAVVNERGQLICVAGLTGRYLQPPAGVLTTNILDIAHQSLRIELRTALHAVARSGKKVVRNDVHVDVEGLPRRLRLTVRPLPGVKHDGLFVVVIQERAGQADEAPESEEPSAPGAENESALAQLESELRITRADLRSTIEELESANEELKSSNEELLSTNEELQSSNEELQSSQEELKSVNEELATVNAELARKVDELARTNSDLQNLFSSTEVVTLFLDREQRVARFTPAAKELFRLIDGDAGRPLGDLAQRFVDQDLTADVAAVLRTLRPVERQVETIDHKAWYLLRVFPYHTVDDVIAGAVVTLADITQVKRAEAERERLLGELREAYEQLRDDLEATGRLLKIGSLYLREGNVTSVLGEIVEAAIAVSGADFGNIQLLNEASGDLEIAAQRGFPERWLRFWDQRCRGQGAGGTALERGERVVIEDVEQSPIFADGQALRVQLEAGVRAVQSTPMIGRKGAPLGMLSTHFRKPGRPDERALKQIDLLARQAADILQSAYAENALRQSEERFRVLVEASSAVLFRMSPDWNEMRQLHSRGFLASSGEPNPDWLHEYIPPEEQPRVLAAIEAAIREKGIFELEHRVVRVDGREGWVLSRAIPVMNEKGEIQEWFGAASDFTARKQAELALEEANERLRESDERKNRFLAVLSHELRNPLAPIRNSIWVLGRAAPGSEQARRAQAVIERQTGHLARLTDDLLDITRITNGKVRLQCEPVELNEVVRQTVEDHRGNFVECGVELVLETAPTEVWVRGDQERLSQAIGNLLQNAVKFTPQGGRTTVSVATELDSPPPRAVIRVQDTGRGIPPEVLPQLFDPFIQADDTLDRSQGGLGLGLALVKGLIEMHEGTVSAASEGQDRGAAFTITLPLEPRHPSAAREHGPHGREPPRRVMIIEDNVDAANSLRELLVLRGHEVEVAYRGPEGIEKARDFRPDVVLCDIGLPDMDGYAVARAMRADPGLGRVRLVALTGYARPEDVAKAKEAGFDAHLTKPLSVDAMERGLRSRP